MSARLARGLSRIAHPFLISPLAIVLLVGLDQGDWGSALRWSAVCAAFVVVPGALYIVLKLRAGEYADADVSVRGQRRALYAFGGVCMALCFVYLLIAGAPGVLIGGFSAAGVALGVAALLNRRWLISVHAGALYGVTTAAAFYAWELAAALAALTGITLWARYILGRHTIWEMLSACTVASVCVLAVFPWFIGTHAGAWGWVALGCGVPAWVLTAWWARRAG